MKGDAEACDHALLNELVGERRVEALSSVTTGEQKDHHSML